MVAYEGKEKYIFVSYAHKDSDVVLPILETLDQAGFRVWFDAGIEAGTEWPAYIEEHLNNSAAVLVFISPSAVASFNCRKEINYAASLNKDMLIVYLEDTVLAKGMNLQLSSLQSIFKYRHTSDNTFIRELSRSQVLLPCRKDGETKDISVPDNFLDNAKKEKAPEKKVDFETALKSGNKKAIIASRMHLPATISVIGAIGSTDPSETWPAGRYTQNINIDQFCSIRFQCNLIRPFDHDGDQPFGIIIFDAYGSIVYEKISEVNFKSSYDRFSTGWQIRDNDGMAVPTGVYTALIWVGNSRIKEFPFRILSEQNEIISPPDEIEDQTGDAPESVPEPPKTPPYLKMFGLNCAYYWLAVLGACLLTVGEAAATIFALPFLGIALFCVIKSFSLTKKNISNNVLLCILLIFIVSPYYSIYLLIMGIIAATKAKKAGNLTNKK